MEEQTLNKERVKKFFDVLAWLAIASNIGHISMNGWADVLVHAAIIFVVGFVASIIFYIFYRCFSGKKAGIFVKKSVGSLLGVFPYLILIVTALNYYNYTNPLAFLVIAFFVIMLLIDILFWLMFFKIIIRKIDEGKGAKMMFSALFIMAIIVASMSGFLIWKNLNQRTVMCTQEAKLCPDGSYVGRTGPKCEFKECPFAFPNQYVEKAITDYLLTQKRFSWKTEENSDNICVAENLSQEKLFPLYIWAHCIEYVVENGEVEVLSGSSGPVKISYPNELSYYDLSRFSYEAPGDGNLDFNDVKKIFPKDLYWKIFYFDREDIIKKAKEEALNK
ncbi:MAG: hypothetical protein PHH21_00955 [Candidatus Pacebacteria bacterium]|nr:hypothetical protein [Candidatus Paceibacterota bacterium]